MYLSILHTHPGCGKVTQPNLCKFALQQSPGFLDLSTAIAWEDIINTDGDNEETWEKFDEHFTKLPGKRAT